MTLHRMTVLIVLVAALAMPAQATQDWARVESTLWVPIPASGPGVTVKLVEDTGEFVRGTWRMIAPGDTLHFAVRGTGMLRLETRAVLGADESSSEFRIGVRTAPSTVRALLRRSDGAQDLVAVRESTGEVAIRAATLDRWETELVAGSQGIDVFLRENREHPVLARVLARGELERPAPAPSRKSRVRWDFQAGLLGAGFDSNAYLAPSDSNSAETALFWPAEFFAGTRIGAARNLELRFDYSFDGLFYGDTILNEYRHRVEARQSWSRVSFGPLGEAVIEFEQRLRTKNRTYFGRGYNEEIETAAGNPPAEDGFLADRYDWREGWVGVDVMVGDREGIGYGATVGFVRRDYVEDYESDPDTYSLDQGGVAGALRVEWRNEANTWARFSAGVRDRRYDEKFARDINGATVRSVESHLVYWPVEIDFGQRPHLGLRWRGGIERERIVDLYQGYWDRTAWRVSAVGTWAFRGGHRLDARVRRSVTNYDRSRVGNIPTGPIREKDTWLIGAEGNYALGRHWRVRASLDLKDRNNNSPEFEYSSWIGMAGLTWSF